MGAEGFDGRVRDWIGCGPLAMTTRPAKPAARCWVWSVPVGAAPLWFEIGGSRLG